jgi:hypothetical protein
MEPNSVEALPRLGLPEWLWLWSLWGPPPPPKAPLRVLIVAFGLVRSLPMLETTLASLARFAPANATLSVRADVPKDLMQAAHACLKRRVALRTLSTILFEAHEAPPVHACNSSKQRAIEHRNEREAAYLLKSVDDDDWVEADVAVLWRIDTELVAPIEAPALPVGRVLLPYLQSGGLLNDRYLVAHATTAQTLIDARAQLLERECVYGETALVRLLRTLNARVGFTRTRIVRVRADGFVPDIDKAASLGTIRPRAWMRWANNLTSALRCNERAALCTFAAQAERDERAGSRLRRARHGEPVPVLSRVGVPLRVERPRGRGAAHQAAAAPERQRDARPRALRGRLDGRAALRGDGVPPVGAQAARHGPGPLL